MKKGIVYVLAGFMMVGFSSQAYAASKPEPIKMRYSNGLSSRHPISKDPKFWAEQIEKRTNGQVKVQVYPNAQLYKHTEVLDAVCWIYPATVTWLPSTMSVK